MTRNTYEVTRFESPYRNTIHSITVFIELPADFTRKVPQDPVTRVRILLYDKDKDNTQAVGICSDG
jgi:hypothetical protein